MRRLIDAADEEFAITSVSFDKPPGRSKVSPELSECVDSSHKFAYDVRMAAINPTELRRVMDRSGVSNTRLVEMVPELSLPYLSDILSGRRRLKRNPEMRQRIAKALDVPAYWIEVQEEAAA